MFPMTGITQELTISILFECHQRVSPCQTTEKKLDVPKIHKNPKQAEAEVVPSSSSVKVKLS